MALISCENFTWTLTVKLIVKCLIGNLELHVIQIDKSIAVAASPKVLLPHLPEYF